MKKIIIASLVLVFLVSASSWAFDLHQAAPGQLSPFNPSTTVKGPNS